MKKLNILVLLIFIFHCGMSQVNPGNVGAANITGWFNPDGLALGNVTSWTTTLPAGALTVTDGLAPFPQATNTPAGNVSNYNTTIEFVGNSSTNMQALENNTSLDLLDNALAGDQGTFFCVYYLPVTSPGDHMMQYNESLNDAIQLRNLGGISRIAISRGISASANATRNWVEPTIPNIISYRGNRSSATSMEAFERDAEITLSGPSQGSGVVGLYFGRRPSQGNSFFNGYLSEFIFYNRDLSLVEMDRVHTYLAIKYGITLQNVGGGTQGDYIATDSTLIWDADLAANYHNGVIGIGRDDTEGLLQKQSHTFNDNTRIYLDTLAINNVSNAGIFNSNVSYVTIGNNAMSVCDTICNTLSTNNCDVISYLERSWKLTKTNFSQSFNLDLSLCDSIEFIANLRLLIDDDGDFTNGGTTCYRDGDATGLTISSTGSVLTLENISNTHIQDNSTAFISIGFIQTNFVNLGNDTSLCQGDTLVLDATTPGSLYLWQDNSIAPTFEVTQTGVYSVRVIPTSGCDITDTINVNYDLLPIIDLGNDTILCEGESLNLDVTTLNATYLWQNNSSNSSFNVAQAGSYNVKVDVGVCSSVDTIDVSYNPLPVVDLGNDRLLCDGDLLILDATLPSATYLWQDSSVSSTLNVGEEGTYSVIVSLNGCISSDVVNVNFETCEINLEMPNIITPNGDGKNDFFVPIINEGVASMKTIIFNRWGNEVFETDDLLVGWDGKNVADGTYFWVINYVDENGKEGSINGYLTVLK